MGEGESKITVPNPLLQRIRKLYPELSEESKETTLRLGLHKLLAEREEAQKVVL